MNLSKAQIKELTETLVPGGIKGWVQDRAYDEWKNYSKRGTLEMATGTGKTRVGLMAVNAEVMVNKDALIYIVVPTETLRDVDWPDEMDKWGYGHLKDNSNVRRICQKSLSKEVPERDVDLIILDEVHHITALGFAFFNRDWKVFSIMGLTATLPSSKFDEDQDKLAIIRQLCPPVFKITLEEAIQLKLVSDFHIVAMLFDLDDKDRKILSGTKAKPEMRTEVQHYQYLTKKMQQSAYNPAMKWQKFTWIQKRTEFLMNLETKLKMAKDVIGEIIHEGRTVIFCGSIDQSVKLCGENVYNSSTDDVKLNAFRNEEISYLGVVNALNEGVNIANLDQAIIVQLSSKELALLQRIGREVRFREGHIARIVILVAKNTADEKWYRNAIANFDKSRIKEYYVKPTT